MATTRSRPPTRRATLRAQLPPIDAPIRIASVEEELEDGLRTWCVASARKVLTEMCEADVERLCGERWRPRSGSRVARAGWCYTDVILGAARVRIRRPRVRSFEGEEVELPSFRFVSERDPLDRETLGALAAVVSTGAPLPGSPRGGRVARRFFEGLAARLAVALRRPHGEPAPCVVVGGLAFRDHWILIALGISRHGTRQLLGLRAGSPASRSAVAGLLADVTDRDELGAGPLLFAVAEQPAVLAAIQAQFGRAAMIQRDPAARRRRVLGLLPPERQPEAYAAMLEAYELTDAGEALRALRRLARALERDHAPAARALRDGLEQTLTFQRLGLGSPAPRSGRRARAAPSRSAAPRPAP